MNGPQTAFPVVRALLVLTIAIAMLIGLTSLVTAYWIGNRSLSETLGYVGTVSWLGAVLGLVPIAYLGPRGVMPAIHGWYAGMALRLAVCVVGVLFGLYAFGLALEPMLLGIAGYYILMLFIEAGIVSKYLWNKDLYSYPSLQKGHEVLT